MHIASRTLQLRESVIREMTRLAVQHGAINLSQGFPDFDPPPQIIEAATRALTGTRDGERPTGHNMVRFAFAKRLETLNEAAERLRRGLG